MRALAESLWTEVLAWTVDLPAWLVRKALDLCAGDAPRRVALTSTLARLALDLRDLAGRDGTSAAFAERFEAMRKPQSRRWGFFDRWKREHAPRR
ncbi:uncharacterized protein SOCEGT47_028970 [Sorangium cellulosum]|uniref:Uncharacterized protein n=1 Tax=Sorangium cellulosum TaxID=56 RepID=A0A4P2Q0I0_SORCE|nr:uncharacterized protein SOCEGT47_028970 [Sorangium cellulosum]